MPAAQPRRCPPSITPAATPLRPRQCAQPMKHLPPKFLECWYVEFETSALERGTGDLIIISISGIRLIRTHSLAEPRSRPSVWRQLNLGYFRDPKVVGLDRYSKYFFLIFFAVALRAGVMGYGLPPPPSIRQRGPARSSSYQNLRRQTARPRRRPDPCRFLRSNTCLEQGCVVRRWR